MESILQTEYAIHKINKTFSELKVDFIFLEKKYVKVPFNLINENIKLYQDSVDVPFDIKHVNISPYSIEIHTLFNENNKNVLSNKMNIVMGTLFPKYEHYICYSSNDFYISFDHSLNPNKITYTEINILNNIYNNNKIIASKLLF